MARKVRSKTAEFAKHLIIITALIMAVVLAVKHDDIDYAKIHPAPTK